MPTERAELVAAILAEPDDDDLRLVCADWFEEQGGDANTARAELACSGSNKYSIREDL